MRKVFVAVVLSGFLAGSVLGQAASGPSKCESLAQLKLTKAKVVSADTVAAGVFAPPANTTPWLAGDPAFYKTLPAFCRVVVQSTPSADSDIKIEVWMQAQSWNESFRGR